MKHYILKLSKVLALLLVVNFISYTFYFRKDLTVDHRYTLSKVSERLVSKCTDRVQIDVYLEGDFPLDFKRLKQATVQHLAELKAINPKLYFHFQNPKGKEQELMKKGMEPSRLSIENDDSVAEMLIFPYAEVTYKGKSTIVPLLLNTGNSQEEQLQKSIENIEYAFSQAFALVQQNKKKMIAVLRSNGTLEDIYLYDVLQHLGTKYNLAPFTLHPKGLLPELVLNDLQQYDVLIIPKPTEKFSENDKFILDQYIMNGGKTLWAIDQVQAEMDSLQHYGEALFVTRDLNITDLLFAYGVRVNFDLVKDLYSSKIAVATGNVGNQVQFKEFLWHYYPLVRPNNTHAISKNVEAVNLKFPTAIDTLQNGIAKHILLQSSPLSKTIGLPNIISLESLADKIDPKEYQSPPKLFGVLLEGNFTSCYAHRTQPFEYKSLKKSVSTKMIIVSDGDVLANAISEGEPTPLDRDKWTGQFFGNRDFILNAVDYLTDDTGLLALRGKDLSVNMLNKATVAQQKVMWQSINLFVPILLTGVFALVYWAIRKRKYTK